jgi:hypothetical protein
MPQRGAAGFRRSDRDGDPLPDPVVAFDPVGEIVARDARPVVRRRDSGAASGAARRPSPRTGSEDGAENRAAALAAMAEAFAAEFGIDDDGPSAAALADRFGFRFEETPSGPAARRTVTITGRGATRAVPPAERSVGRRRVEGRRRSGRPDSLLRLNADRAALWAVGLALVLALVAAMSAHGLAVH